MSNPEKHEYSHREPHLFTRAARLLQFGRADPAVRNQPSSPKTTDGSQSEKTGLETIGETPAQSALTASKAKAAADDAALKDNLDRRRHVRTLPPWIHSLQQGENTNIEDQAPTRLIEPPKTKTPHRNHMPAPKNEPRLQAARGRIWDHARSGEAVTMPFPLTDQGSRWLDFLGSSSYARNEDGQVVDDAWIKENVPDLDQPYVSARDMDDAEKDERLWLLSDEKRSATFRHFQIVLMKNPFVPLVIRLTVMAFCLVALALGVQIWRRSNTLNHAPAQDQSTDQGATGDFICKQQTSTYMAFIVDSCAVVYLLYITYDEYFSKPLGLRSSKDKIRLLFLDLGFIIFSAANLSLAFSTLTDQQWSCYDNNPGDLNLNNDAAARSTCITDANLCEKQKGLVSVLLVAEIAWVSTFAISTLRVIERIQR